MLKLPGQEKKGVLTAVDFLANVNLGIPLDIGEEVVFVGGGKIFQHRQSWEAYFDESIKGLAVGAPVTFRGVKVGSVTDVRVVVNRDVAPDKVTTDVIRTPVFFEISADRIGDVAGQEIRFEEDNAGMKRLVDFGLRAQLELQSLVTGQLGINLDFHLGVPAPYCPGCIIRFHRSNS